MIKCINSRRLEGAGNLDELCRQAVERGFAALEIAVGRLEPIKPEMIEQEGDEIFRTVNEHDLKLCSVTSCDYDLFSLAADEVKVAEALKFFSRLLSFAQHSRDNTMVTIGAHVIKPLEEITVDSYEETFNRLYDSLQKLSDLADSIGTQLALENPGGGVLLSPLELRELIDEVNSPYLGVSFNPENARRLGKPSDWFAILGQRIKALRLSSTIDYKNEFESEYIYNLFAIIYT